MNWGSNTEVSSYFKSVCEKLKSHKVSFIEAPADLATVELVKISKDKYPTLFCDSIDSEFYPNQAKNLVETPSVVFSVVDYVDLNTIDRYSKINEAYLNTKDICKKIVKRIEVEYRKDYLISVKKVSMNQISGQTALHFGTIVEIQFQLGPIEFNKTDWKDGDIL